jgi:hypothetical protein
MTIVTVVLVAVVVLAVGLRWRKLRRDARRRRWSAPHDVDPLEASPRVRIVGDNHVPTDPTGPVTRPTLDGDRRYVFGENVDDSPATNGLLQRRDKALERVGRRRRRLRSPRRRS